MKTRFVFIALASIFLIALLSNTASAWYYYPNYYNSDFDTYSYSSERTSGSMYGPTYTKSVNYDRTTSTAYLPNGGYEKTMTYTRTIRESPDNCGYYGCNYYNPRYNYYYPQYNYYPRYNYYYSRPASYDYWY